jgi:hypothetical protein
METNFPTDFIGVQKNINSILNRVYKKILFVRIPILCLCLELNTKNLEYLLSWFLNYNEDLFFQQSNVWHYPKSPMACGILKSVQITENSLSDRLVRWYAIWGLRGKGQKSESVDQKDHGQTKRMCPNV